MTTVHATAVRLDGRGVLIRGASGSGKSRLAMALLEQAGAASPLSLATDEPHNPSQPQPLGQCANALIGDDRLTLSEHRNGLHASPASGLEGLMEVRGFAILSLPWCAEAPLHLVIDLVPPAAMERLPEPALATLAGHQVRQLALPIGDLAHQLLLVQLALRTMAHQR